MIAMCVRGRLVVSRTLPSFSRIKIVPVSATPKLTPLMPTSAAAKRSRRTLRAVPVKTSTSSVGAMPSLAENNSAICFLDLCIAGTTMWDGVS
jgi:hypothetical protein